MDNTLPLHLRKFNEKVRIMNQTNAKLLTLTLAEANNLQAEIYTLMTENIRLAKAAIEKPLSITTIEVDGGSFGT
jgi:hypothetical protein